MTVKATGVPLSLFLFGALPVPAADRGREDFQ